MINQPAKIEPPILPKVRAKNRDAFSALVTHYQMTVYSIARQITKDSYLTDDACQVCYEGLYRFAVGISPLPESAEREFFYIIRCATNSANHVLEKAAGKLRIVGAPGPSQDPPAAPSRDPLEIADERRLVSHALEQLSPNLSPVVSLYFFEGCSYAEIATRLGISLGAVKSRMNAAMSRLRVHLCLSEPGAHHE